MEPRKTRVMPCLVIVMIVCSITFVPFSRTERAENSVNDDVQGMAVLTGIGAPQLEWNYSIGETIRSSPCLADIGWDDGLEILLGADDKKLYCLNSTGSLKWTFTTGGLIRLMASVADVDNDGELEIIVCSDKLYCINVTGALEWSYTTGGLISSAACIANLDSDSYLEILIASDKFYCINGDGNLQWSVLLYPIFASPCVADIDLKDSPEILIGDLDTQFYCLNIYGTTRWRVNTAGTGQPLSSCFIANVDNQGELEILASSVDGMLFCIDANGSTKWTYTDVFDNLCSTPTAVELDDAPGMETIVCSWDEIHCVNSTGGMIWKYKTDTIIRSSQCIADIDGDLDLEILVGKGDFDIAGGFLCLSNSGNLKWVYNTSNSVKSTPCAADIDNDGAIEVLFTTYDTYSNRGFVYCVSVVGAPFQPTSYCWPSIGFMGNVRRTGCFEDDDSDDLANNYETTAGSSPDHADTDTDNASDYQEFVASTDPTLDQIFPETIDDLAVIGAASDAITLSWTAPGDNGNAGTVQDYIVKYSTVGPIDADNWNEAVAYEDDWIPQPGGSTEVHVVAGLSSSTTYWFAIVAADETPNNGGISNSPQGATTYNLLLISALAGTVIGLGAIIVVVIIKRRHATV